MTFDHIVPRFPSLSTLFPKIFSEKNRKIQKIPYFNLEVPTQLDGVAWGILDPRDTYQNRAEWEEKAKDLAGRFIKNFKKYETSEKGKSLVKAGPQL